MPARQTISSLDKLIDANRAALVRLVGHEPDGAAGWQAAWDLHPDLHARDCELFRQRGHAQIERDSDDAKRAARKRQIERRAARSKLPRKCPTCGCHTLRAA